MSNFSAKNINHLWAKLFIAELVRQGVEEIVISSGSRSTPLVIAAAEQTDVKIIIHYDERGAAFYALGYGKATGKPAVLICTSGTALLNYYPAIAEAAQSRTPLIILSSDRPLELRDNYSPQSIEQVKVFGNYLRWSIDLPAPTIDVPVNYLLTTAGQAYYRATNLPAGVVQINCQFREPLAPLGEDHNWNEYLGRINHWLERGDCYSRYLSKETDLDETDRQLLFALIENANRGIIVVGTLPQHQDNSTIIKLSEQLGWPIFADVCSGLRFQKEKTNSIVCHYDLFLRQPQLQAGLKPDVILQFGDLPTSKFLQQYIENSDADYLLINNHPFRQDTGHAITMRVEAEPTRFAEKMIEWLDEDHSELLEDILKIDNLAHKAATKHIKQNNHVTEYALANKISNLINNKSALFLASSMPIRDFDALTKQRNIDIKVCANRGANGIDGTIATAVGFAKGTKRTTTLAIGDLAFLHDLNSLALVNKSEYPLIIVVINNNGGGIFSFLPIAKDTKYFEKYFGTPHNYNFKQAAKMFDLDYYKPNTLSDFEQVYKESQQKSSAAIIEVKTDRTQNFQDHQQLWQDVWQAIHKKLF